MTRQWAVGVGVRFVGVGFVGAEPEPGALVDAESVLLIDDNEGEVPEADAL
jgi:hypothetical protein